MSAILSSSILCCRSHLKRILLSDIRNLSDHQIIRKKSLSAERTFHWHRSDSFLSQYFLRHRCRTSHLHTSAASSSNKDEPPKKDDPSTKDLVTTQKEEKEIDVTSGKELMKPDEEGERRVSTVTGKTRDKITAYYNNRQNLIKIPYVKPYESTYEANRPLPPFERTVDMLKPIKKRKTKFYHEDFQAFYDIVIIGGGIMGTSIAYWLSERLPGVHSICVIERDPTYRTCSTTLSVGGLRQQFSLPENIQMSMFGADFLRNANRLLYVDGKSNPDVQFQPHGYLFLATEEGAEIMQENHKVQIECGAKVELLTAKRLKHKFPWLNTDGIALGSYGYENEGWFDPWSLLAALKMKAIANGVDFCHGEVYNMAHDLRHDQHDDDEEDKAEEERLSRRIEEAHVHLPNGDIFPINSALFVIAAGADSGHIGHLCGFGMGKGILQVPIPVEPRKRFVYNVHCPTGPGLDCPLVVDPSGAYFRREGLGNHYLCGMSPAENEEPAIDNDDIDFDFYDNKVWPIIANRVPAFESSKVKSAWCGFYDYNTWDQNAIVGNHPVQTNVFLATGFSGHGIQQAPAIGRAIMELIIEQKYQTIDLSRLSFDRILNDVEMRERNIV